MIVTRFAPSPTGYLHVGGARTALFCWLMAKHNGGKMILRIEDTDQKRNTPTATKQVIKDLRWLGIDWDEGPDVGGPNGPYMQSQRRDIYDRYIKKLLDEGKAYYCFERPEELQAMRDKAIAEKKTFLYPRPQSFPDAGDVEKARAEGRPVAVRFAVPELETIVVEDIVRGQVSFPGGEFGDFVIQKSDGFPTYHFGCVVDDELMGITHVIRGQEHLMNTPNHQLLQDALGFRRLAYAHMSVTVSEGGGKLSKRDRAKTLLKVIKGKPDIDKAKLAQAAGLEISEFESFLTGKSSPDAPIISAMAEHLGVHLPEINVVDFFHGGYLPEAMVNFTALLGWSPGDDREIMSLEELIEAFDIKRLAKTNSLFDRQKLVAFNTEHIRRVGPERLLKHFKDYLTVSESPLVQKDDETLAYILRANQGAQTFEQIADKCGFLLIEKVEFDPKAVKKVLRKEGAADLLGQVRTALSELEVWDKESLHTMIEQLCQKNEVGMGKVAQPIRVAITGTTISPPIDDSLILLKKEQTLKRIDAALEYITHE
ncbi:MAG: glutamate--tRNA ligase [Sedimentisphaerales bacterium]|nr:glutamate--tRNA ligase [Sedimentisphaerales bacterium]